MRFATIVAGSVTERALTPSRQAGRSWLRASLGEPLDLALRGAIVLVRKLEANPSRPATPAQQVMLAAAAAQLRAAASSILVSADKARAGSVESRVSQTTRDNFAAFLVEWLGGPRIYSTVHGHPRLRMRHGHVPIGTDQRDAWLRCMNVALEHPEVDADVRDYLRQRFAEVADFLRNRPGA